MRTGKVNSYGKVKMALPTKLPKGKSTLKITKVGTTTAGGVERLGRGTHQEVAERVEGSVRCGRGPRCERPASGLAAGR